MIQLMYPIFKVHSRWDAQGIQTGNCDRTLHRKGGGTARKKDAMAWSQTSRIVVQNDTSFGMRQRDAAHALSGGGPIRPVSNSPSHWYWRGCRDDPKQTANTRAPTLPIQL